MEPRLTMWAWGAARSRGRKVRVTRSSPTTLVSIMACQSSSRPSATGSRPTPVPALLTSRSTWPWRSPTAAAKAWTEAGSVTSRARVVAPTSSARPWRRSVRRAPATTWKPARASRRALAAPIPLDAPVTTAIRSPAMAALLSALGRVGPLGGEPIDQAARGHHGRPVQAQVVLDPAPAPGLDRAAVGARAPQLRVDQGAQHRHGVGPAAAVDGGHHGAVVGLQEGPLLVGQDGGHGCSSAVGSGTPAAPGRDGSGYATGPGRARQASPAAARSSQNPG